MQRKNVGIFVNEMFHYREGIYRLLLESNRHNINIFTGNKKNTDLPITEIPEIKFKIFGNTFWYQKGLRKLIDNYNLDIVIIQYTPYMISSRLLTFFNNNRNYKIVAWTHGYYRGNRNGFKAKTLERALKRADGILFFSEDMIEYYKNKGFDEEKMFYTDNTLNTDKISAIKDSLSESEIKGLRNKYRLNNRKVIIFVGRIIKSKRLNILLKAMKWLKENCAEIPFLFIIGDGPQKNILKNEYSDILKNNISWEGKIIQENKIAPYFKLAEISVMPGKTGLSVNHSFAYGVPYITTDSDIHAPEIILLKEGVNGECFVKDDHIDLAQKIDKLLHSPDKLNYYSNNAIKTIKERYNVHNMYNNFINLIENI